MTKEDLNQKTSYEQDLINTFETDFIFNNKPVNRFNAIQTNNSENISDKPEKLLN